MFKGFDLDENYCLYSNRFWTDLKAFALTLASFGKGGLLHMTVPQRVDKSSRNSVDYNESKSSPFQKMRFFNLCLCQPLPQQNRLNLCLCHLFFFTQKGINKKHQSLVQISYVYSCTTVLNIIKKCKETYNKTPKTLLQYRALFFRNGGASELARVQNFQNSAKIVWKR